MTLRSLATEFATQTCVLAAYFDLGRDYDEDAELDEATTASYREVWAAGADVDA
jgi:hypothetical protein